MQKINERPQEWIQRIRQAHRGWKIAAIIGILILAGVGVALLRNGGVAPGVSIFGIQSVPSLTKSVGYSSDLSPEVKTTLEGLIADLRTQLTKNNTDYEAWLTLAIRYKQAGDLDKARAVWEYLASIHPDDAVSRHNLGDLYHHFLNDYAKAESYYKEAVDLAPTNSLDYLALHELYRYSYKQNTTNAVDIVKLGIERVTELQPIDLYVALATYYADAGDRANAIESFAKARDLAKNAGNRVLAAKLDAEIAALKK